MTRYGRSPWVLEAPKARTPTYPSHRGSAPAPVVIVGGGLTGCATAYAFAAAGIPVVLLEADRIGLGSTAYSAGWIGGEPGASFVDVEKALGRKGARETFRAWHRAALDFAALLRRLDVKYQPQPSLTVALDADQATRLSRERKSRRDAGLDAPLVNGRVLQEEIAIERASAIRGTDGGVLDPYRTCHALARAAVERGAIVYERSAVEKVGFDRKTATVVTAGGSILTGRVVVATGVPTALNRSLARHFWFKSTYCALTAPVPARVRQQLGQRTTVIGDLAQPPHVVRWVDGERLLVSGADSVSPPERTREATIVQRTGQLMYELSLIYPDISGIQPAYGWESRYALTGDGLPYLGPHRNFPHHLFAFGDASHTVTGAYLAGRVLLRHHLGEADAADAHFSFTRHGD